MDILIMNLAPYHPSNT